MAIFNEILVARYSRFLQKIFGMKGGAAVRQLTGELSASVVIPSGVENRFPASEKCMSARLGTNAVAAQDSVARIRNPVGSGVIAVIEQINFDAGQNTIVFLDGGPVAADLTNLITGFSLDSRWKDAAVGTGGSACQVSWANNIAAFGTTFGQQTIPANTSGGFQYINGNDEEIPLLPGQGIQLRTSVVNTSLNVCFRWRERALEDSES